MNIAALSDNLVALAIGIYAVAFTVYAADLAKARTGARFGARTRSTTPAAVTGSANPVDSPVAVDPDGPPEDVAAPDVNSLLDRSDRSDLSRTALIAGRLLTIACGVNIAAVVARGVAAGRAPWGNMYEFAMVGAAAIATAFVVGSRRHRIEGLGIGVAGLVLVCLGLAVTVLYTPVDALIPVLNSYWMVIHVAAAIVAGGVFTIAALASGAFLIQRRRERANDSTSGIDATSRGTGTGLRSETLERVSYGLIVFAFPIWTFAVIAGAVWAEAAWGRYWGWDPKETWAFITWVLYAAYLHAQSTAGWRGTRAAWFSLLGYAAFLFNFVGVNMWISGLHSYAGV
ncbi:c-type cytochrome biogenesis protein CcsB [Nocardioides ferulae]|uniref:c-type cytochrome biogenesis protein CcsB n=1 Tax=Nocardioides ferulae TaxID=2340821 RepID=UPI000EB16888|nr:c-type cytochrome biogenesis protein CcsB [Nocardioides ferulae]